MYFLDNVNQLGTAGLSEAFRALHRCSNRRTIGEHYLEEKQKGSSCVLGSFNKKSHLNLIKHATPVTILRSESIVVAFFRIHAVEET
jgi:hypothetical protein